MRLVSQEINKALEANESAPANFGLAFNKWLVYQNDGGTLKPVAKDAKQPLIDCYEKSRKAADKLLQNIHLRQFSYCQSLEAVGWHAFVIEAVLSSAFVSGLGMSHPTETGLVLDHTTGIPYIPAAGQKGVMRLAHMINSMLDAEGKWRELDWLYERGIIKDVEDNGEVGKFWQEDKASKTLFGFSDKNDSLAGQLVALDAYPLNAPQLAEEILNPHFQKYYAGDHGPTEDQSPVPVKFLVVKPGARFVFRFLLRRSLSKALDKDYGRLIDLVEKNIYRALTDEGMGAKTAIGFGRFKIIAKKEPEVVENWLAIIEREKEAIQYPWRPLLRKLENITVWNWGLFKQEVLGNKNLAEYKREHEVGLAVKNIAERVKTDKPKKWTIDRAQETQKWLSLFGISWHEEANGENARETMASPEEMEAVDMINAITDWGTYLQSNLQLKELPKAALKVLSKRMKKEWGCGGKKAKSDKKNALRLVIELIRHH